MCLTLAHADSAQVHISTHRRLPSICRGLPAPGIFNCQQQQQQQQGSQPATQKQSKIWEQARFRAVLGGAADCLTAERGPTWRQQVPFLYLGQRCGDVETLVSAQTPAVRFWISFTSCIWCTCCRAEGKVHPEGMSEGCCHALRQQPAVSLTWQGLIIGTQTRPCLKGTLRCSQAGPGLGRAQASRL